MNKYIPYTLIYRYNSYNLASSLSLRSVNSTTLRQAPASGCTVGSRLNLELSTERTVIKMVDRRKRMTQDTVGEEVVLRFLPPGLVLMYESLAHRGLVLGDSSGYDESVDTSVGQVTTGRTSSSQKEYSIRKSAGAGKYGSGRKVVRSEAAVEYRKKIDRRLRKIAKEIENFLSDEEVKPVVSKKCPSGRCGLFGESGWTYCPNCGTVLQERQIKQ